MFFLYFSEYLNTYWPALLFACICTVLGSCWIDSLYRKELPGDLLSFPEQVTQRARFRKPLLFLLLAVCIGKAWSSVPQPALFYVIITIALLSFVTVTDFEQYVIFDAMLLPLALIGVLYIMHLRLPITEHIVAALGGSLLFFMLTVITKGAIGGGDIKLIAVLGFWLGIRPLLSVIAYGFLTGGVAVAFLLITRQKHLHDYFAYGPYFTLTGIGILLGYLRLLF